MTHSNNLGLWPLVWDTLQTLTAHYGPAIDHEAEKFGVPYGEWYGWLMAAKIFEPEPVSAARLHVRAAYTNPDLLDRRLQSGVELGLLAPEGEGTYRLTQAGHEAVERLIAAAYGAVANLEPLPDAELDELLGLLRRLVYACLTAPEPPGKWCLRIARHYDPGGRAGRMPQLDQYLSDLVAYRDDAHLAAWQQVAGPLSGISGQAWETLTHVWTGAVSSLDELCARHCARRGYPCESYAAVLDDLEVRGWVISTHDVYELTESGRAVREAAEDTTNRYFFAPWACLSAVEMPRLRGLLNDVCGALLAVAR